jgi:hypothetical protein
MRLHARALGVLTVLGLACGESDAPAGDGTAEADTGEATDGATTSPDPTHADTTGATTGVDATRPDWVHDIAPLVQTHCVSCHAEGGVAPFALTSYEDAATWAGASAAQVQLRQMPPWHAIETDECTPPLSFKHDARLPDDAIEAFAAWADNGAPMGDPDDAAPLPDPPATDLVDPTATAIMSSTVSLPGADTVRDSFHCLSLDPGNTEDVYIDAMQVLPGNREVVHHVLMYVDESAESASWEGGVLEDCGGGAGISSPVLVGGWVPGSRPIETPAEVAMRLPAGARIIFNMHYHNGSNEPKTDEGTGVAMRWSTTVPRYVGTFNLVGAPGVGTLQDPPFLIPADATGHVERVRYTVPDFGVAELRVFAITNHMHKVGVDMRVTITRGSDETCMLQTPSWDYDWQRQYLYDAEIDALPEVLPGDVVEVRCTYDNVIGNPGVAEALAEVGLDAPQDVTLGEGTLDEMCLAGVGVAVRAF